MRQKFRIKKGFTVSDRRLSPQESLSLMRREIVRERAQKKKRDRLVQSHVGRALSDYYNEILNRIRKTQKS